jgi:DMATS type aromatic prenyltransferase
MNPGLPIPTVRYTQNINNQNNISNLNNISNNMKLEHAEADDAWTRLSTWLPPRNTDNHWWFKATGPQLVRLLSEAGYPLSQQYETLLFHYQAVVPHLGPKLCSSQPHWNSFITNDFSPIEYSWKWGMGSNRPEIRYGIEALGYLTGTAVDPLNQISTCELLYKLRLAMPELDLTWFHHFRRSLFGLGTPAANGTE